MSKQVSRIKRLYIHARGYNIDPTSRKIASRFLALTVIVFDLFPHVGLISIAVWVVCGEDWVIITSVVGQVSKSFAMILRRPIEFFYCWLSLIAIFLSGCSSIEKNHRDVNRFHSARSVLKSWRRKAQEQSARFFDRLPKNPEVFYTPVNKITTP